MTSKTVWIAGGIAVAIGVVAYVGYNGMPAGLSGAGTIVEVKRAQTDGTNAFNPNAPTATPDQQAKDSGTSGNGADRADATRADANRADANRADANRADANRADANRADANRADANRADANRADANRADANRADPNRAPSDYGKTRNWLGRHQTGGPRSRDDGPESCVSGPSQVRAARGRLLE